MLPRVVLFVLQLAAAWYFADWLVAPIVRGLGLNREYHVLVFAVIYAVIVMVVGLGGGAVLKEVSPPSAGTFAVSLVLALAFAVVTLVPQVWDQVTGVVQGLRGNQRYLPLFGAMLGYLIKR